MKKLKIISIALLLLLLLDDVNCKGGGRGGGGRGGGGRSGGRGRGGSSKGFFGGLFSVNLWSSSRKTGASSSGKSYSSHGSSHTSKYGSGKSYPTQPTMYRYNPPAFGYPQHQSGSGMHHHHYHGNSYGGSSGGSSFDVGSAVRGALLYRMLTHNNNNYNWYERKRLERERMRYEEAQKNYEKVLSRQEMANVNKLTPVSPFVDKNNIYDKNELPPNAFQLTNSVVNEVERKYKGDDAIRKAAYSSVYLTNLLHPAKSETIDLKPSIDLRPVNLHIDDITKSTGIDLKDVVHPNNNSPKDIISVHRDPDPQVLPLLMDRVPPGQVVSVQGTIPTDKPETEGAGQFNSGSSSLIVLAFVVLFLIN